MKHSILYIVGAIGLVMLTQQPRSNVGSAKIPLKSDLLMEAIYGYARRLELYLNSRGWKEGRMVLLAMEEKARYNVDYRKALYKWVKSGDTVELREIAKKAGFDYWKSLDHANGVDALDSAWLQVSF